MSNPSPTHSCGRSNKHEVEQVKLESAWVANQKLEQAIDKENYPGRRSLEFLLIKNNRLEIYM